MFTDYIEIGPAPADEPCAQVGEINFRPRAAKEMRAFIAQLRRVFGPEPVGAKLTTRWFPHDFGEYGEVICAYSRLHPAAIEYALRCETETPLTWDEEARRELGILG